MKVLITGSGGQLGKSLKIYNPLGIEIINTTKKDLDISKKNDFENFIFEIKPDWVINCAAYTDVEKAETNKNLSYLVNSEAVNTLALALLKTGGKLIHISTDYVFDGKGRYPYRVNQRRNPINIYGSSKASGEEVIESICSRNKNAIILRTSWLMGPFGKNFCTKILNLLETSNELSIVNDQIGSPTSSLSLARICWEIIFCFKNKKELPLIMHWCDSGKASWFEVAKYIEEKSLEIGLTKKEVPILPINSDAYLTLAKRPKYSVLDNSESLNILKVKSLNWKESILEVLIYLKNCKN